MFEYQAENITRNRYNFESAKFSADSCCWDIWDNQNVDLNDCVIFSQEYEIDIFFSSVSTEDWREISIQGKRAEQQLHNDLFVHSVDSRVGF